MIGRRRKNWQFFVFTLLIFEGPSYLADLLFHGVAFSFQRRNSTSIEG